MFEWFLNTPLHCFLSKLAKEEKEIQIYPNISQKLLVEYQHLSHTKGRPKKISDAKNIL